MSRASVLREAVKAELETDFGGTYTVDSFIVPRWDREDLVDLPRIAVRVGGRELRFNQGPDEKDIAVQVGVVGLTPDGADATAGFAALELARIDVYDGLLEEIIDLWMNNGRLASIGVGDHYPVNISQPIQFDPQQLEKGVYLTMIEITYRDSED